MNRNIQTQTAPISNAGFTLVEAMIALLIFSVGLLGLAGLQATALQNNKTADMRSIAIIAAHDMAERIRANQRGGSNHYWNISGPASKPGKDCTIGTCNANEVADWDAYEWETSLATQLPPSGTGTVSRTSSSTPYSITVMWDEAHTGAKGTGCSGDPNVDLKCYKMDFMP